MKINVIFYEDPNSKDCNVLGVYRYKSDAKQWLENHGWYFDIDCCIWHNFAYNGFVEILERDLQ